MRRSVNGALFSYNPATVGDEDMDEALVIADGVRAAGIASEVDLIPESLGGVNQNERRARAHGISRTAALDQSYWDRFRTAQISSAESRWRGANSGGYNNAHYDWLYEQWFAAVDSSERDQKEADLHQLLLDETVYLPLFYDIEVFAFQRRVDGPKPFGGLARNVMIDVHSWTLD
jgi:ABC-type transport system substrate-binding protein